ncbi:MAG: mechanosensitive ion channel family protein [Gammaproteobacteria bacterium]|nr:mechanosensitive ion channel family protein [Gammaproteobacteria bacterium]
MFNKIVAIYFISNVALVASSAVELPNEPIHSTTTTVTPDPQQNLKSIDYPVIFADHELFVVRSSPLSSLTPAKRASNIQQNILNFADSDIDTNTLMVVNSQEGISIGSKENVLVVITEQDALAAGKSIADFADDVLKRISMAISEYRNRHLWDIYGSAVIYSIFTIIGLWFALFLNNRAFVWLKKKVEIKEYLWKKGIYFRGIEVLSGRKIDIIVQNAINTIRLFVILMCLYFMVPLILSYFPETRQLSLTIFQYLLTPIKSFFYTIVNYIPNVFYILVIVFIAYYTLKVISKIFKLIEHGDLKFDWFYEDWARPTYQIIRFLVIVTALIGAYPYIPGSSTLAFQGVGLVLGAIISFASSSAISNIVAGIILTYTRAFRLNDRIQVGDTVGDVVEKTLLVTRVKTIKHVVVTIPNSLVMGSQIINYSTSSVGEGVILHTSVTIGYDVPWQQVQSLLVEAALATEGIQQLPTPFVFQTSLGDWYVNYEINGYTQTPEKMADIYSDLHENILIKFNDAGVEIMSPHYFAVRDGNASTVPSILNAKGYSAPEFSVTRTE